MSAEKEEKHPKIEGVIQALKELIKALLDLERKGLIERASSGKIATRWYTTEYCYHAKLGIKRKDFSRPYRKFRSSKRKKDLIKVIDKGNIISLVAKLPAIKEEEFKIEQAGNKLNIVAEPGKNKIERSILLAKELGVQKALFRNGILELELTKKE